MTLAAKECNRNSVKRRAGYRSLGEKDAASLERFRAVRGE
jgi:hypothetical protein